MNLQPNEHPADISMGTASVELMEFADFTCHRCRQLRELVNEILTTFDGQVTYNFHHFLNHHNESSVLAALASEAARRQGYFWPMYHALFSQPILNHDTLSSLAIHLGLDHPRFLRDLKDEKLHQRIELDQQQGIQLGVTRTPTLYVAGQQFHGKLTESRLIPVIRSQLSRLTRPVLSKVDVASGTIYWGNGEWS